MKMEAFAQSEGFHKLQSNFTTIKPTQIMEKKTTTAAKKATSKTKGTKAKKTTTTKTKKKGLSGTKEIPKEAAYYAKKNFGNDTNGNPHIAFELYDKSGYLLEIHTYTYGPKPTTGLIEIGVSGYITKGFSEYKKEFKNKIV